MSIEDNATENILHTADIILAAFNKLPDGVAIVDSNGNIVMINEQLEFMTGYTRTELKGQPVEILLPENLRERHVSHRFNYMLSPFPRAMGENLRLEILRKNKSLFSVEIALNAIAVSSGIYVLATVRRTRS